MHVLTHQFAAKFTSLEGTSIVTFSMTRESRAKLYCRRKAMTGSELVRVTLSAWKCEHITYVTKCGNDVIGRELVSLTCAWKCMGSVNNAAKCGHCMHGRELPVVCLVVYDEEGNAWEAESEDDKVWT